MDKRYSYIAGWLETEGLFDIYRLKDYTELGGENLTNDEITNLIRFFTLAENYYKGWNTGSVLPVIWLTKALKKEACRLIKNCLIGFPKYLPIHICHSGV